MRDREMYRVQGGQFASSDKYLMSGDKPIAMFVRQAWYGDSDLPDRIAHALNSQQAAELLYEALIGDDLNSETVCRCSLTWEREGHSPDCVQVREALALYEGAK